ncbi:N-acetylmuramoyl-L-alanine amidase [Nocardiopsis gilva YIM 90087]|uniref:N-acetylmuramoyl-L-alanine amidase n=2 Tax=Nocardiopsis gilva TaxID=280236 RepID=A0A223SDR6_9ACTN|nr:N-acetylmuramoyl-L-alanine amidase [Nocardiopsis gilva YIM 90087]
MATLGSTAAANRSTPTESAPTPGTTPGERGVPQTLTERSTASTTTPRMVRPEAGFDYVAVRSGENAPRSAAIRFEAPDGLTEWRSLHFHGDGRDDRPATPAALTPVPAGCTGYEISAEGTDRAECVAMNLHDGGKVRMGGRPVGELYDDTDTDPKGGLLVKYRTRAGWGADESLRFNDEGEEEWPTAYYPVQAITVHHSAWEIGDDGAAANVRAIYHLHAVENGWGDIGYHLLIDPDGTVYEGRWSGSDLMPIFRTIPLPGRAEAVTAGHVYQFNSGNIGICMLGDFTDRMPTQKAQDSLVHTLRALCWITGVDPVEEVEYVNPVNGKKATQQGVSRHRDWLPTECPGNTFAEHFDTAIRQRVARGLV